MQEEINQIELAMPDEDVMQLRNIARHIEKYIGRGALSEDVRNAADKLHELINKRH
jgi:hypothetical protein